MPMAASTETGSTLRERSVEVALVPQVVVDRSGFVVSANERARKLFDLTPTDVGRPFQDLELSYRPVDLRSALEVAYSKSQVVTLGRSRWSPARGGPPATLEVTVTPVTDPNREIIGASITFADVTEIASLDARHEQAQRQLETAYEELQSTVEELETTNEELQSTNEELETTNEELQSTNEELETMNEELQSTNEELETMNEDQRIRARELDRVNMFLEGILGNLGVGVIVLDRQQHIQVWNASSRELWGLAADEVEGVHFQSLDIGLPVDRLREEIKAALSPDGKSSDVTLDAVNRRGRAFSARVRMMPMLGTDGANHGVVILVGDAAQGGDDPAH
jgi:two-component system, chemotaxis family, CheB/CheR fusion protein